MAPESPAPATPVLLTNVNVFTGKSLALEYGMSVLIRDGLIADLQPGSLAPAAGTVTVDGGGRTLMPGLIDNHTHLFLSANTQAQIMDENADPEELFDRTRAEATRTLLRGFTCVRDMGGPVFGIKRDIDNGTAIGPRIYPSGAVISQTAGHGDFRPPGAQARRFGGQPSVAERLGATFIVDGRDEILTAVRENLRAGASQIKVLAGGGVVSAFDPIDVAQYTLDEMTAAVQATTDWNTYVTVHAYTPKAVRRAIQAGVACVEHGQLLDEPTVQLLADKGIWLSLQAFDEEPETASQFRREKNHEVVEGQDQVFRWARKYGVKVAYGTDILFGEPTEHQNKRFTYLSRWFSPAEALRIATYDNAQLLALSGPRNPYPAKLGIIEPGAYADVLLVDGDPTANLELIGNPDNFRVIIKDGRIVKNTLGRTGSRVFSGRDGERGSPVS